MTPNAGPPSSAPSRLLSSIRSALGRVDPALWGILAVFLALTLPRLGAVPMWDSRNYYDRCLMDPLASHFNLLDLNCFGHPSMLFMVLFVPGQLLSFGSAVLLNLTNVLLGVLAIGAFWVLTTISLPGLPAKRAPAATGLSRSGRRPRELPEHDARLRGARLSLVLPRALLTESDSGRPWRGCSGLLKEFGFCLRPGDRDLRDRSFCRGKRTLRERLRGIWKLDPGRASAPVLRHFRLHVLDAPTEAVWGGKAPAASAVTRFVRFNPTELFFGRYGPLIWVLSFSWVLTALLLVAALRLAAFSRARAALRSLSVSKASLLFLVLFFAAAVSALIRRSRTRYLRLSRPCSFSCRSYRSRSRCPGRRCDAWR